MNRLLTTLLTTLITLSAYCYTADDLPVSTQFIDSLDFNAVSNPDGILSTAEVDSLNSILWSMRKNQGVQGLIICIKESDPDDPYEFSMQVARKYGVGGKQDVGFVMMVSTMQHGYQILTGDGMEKFLTDAQCSYISRNIMVPELKKGEWGRALIAGLTTIDGICKGEVELNTANDTENEDEGDIGLALLALFGPIGGICGLMYYNNRKAHKCPKCAKHNYAMRKRTVQKLEGDGETVEVVDLFTCSDCNYAHERQYMSTTEKFYIGTFDGKGPLRWGEIAAATAAGASISSGRGFGRGGGFGGGGGGSFHSTFGGGHFSGGGSGGRF